MGKTLNEQPQATVVADIVYHGEKLILPDGMKLPEAINLLERRMEFEEEETVFNETYDCFPLDGAHALDVVLTKKFGWAPATATPGFFGKNPPAMLSVETSPGVVKQVAWGRFSLPNIEGYVQTSAARKENRICFSLAAKIKRKDERVVRAILDEVRAYLKTGSIYMGKAIKIRFRDDDGQPLDMPEPKFIDTSKIDPNALIYAAPVQAAVETNLFTPIRRVQDLIANDIPVKRGVLLGGIYGTGKTMAATVASKYAVDNGITYVYIPRADELSDAIEFAKQYQSPACVIFCEDIDRVTAGERSVEMDDILNLLDGIDTKSARIITVLTTNALEVINPALLRPGRLDAVIDVTPPDAQAVEKLLRLYAGAAIEPTTDLSEAGRILQGNIPAVIAEVIKRAKLSQVGINEPGQKVLNLSQQAVVEAAATLQSQIDLLARRSAAVPPKTTISDLVLEAAEQAVTKQTEPLSQRVNRIAEHFGVA
jgi:transitional endoplasmic reticulum ATPase